VVIWYRNLVGSLDKNVIWNTVFVSVLFIFVAGYSFSTLFHDQRIRVGDTHVPYPAYVVGGFIALNSLEISAIAAAIIWDDLRNGMLEQMSSMPIGRFYYLLGNLLTVMTLGIVGGIITFLIGLPALVGYLQMSLTSSLLLISTLIVSSIFFGSILIITSSIIKRRESYTVTYNSILTLALVSSAFYPTENVPPALQYFFYINPMTHISDIIRATLFSQVTSIVLVDFGILSALTLGVLIIGLLSFRKISYN
jgi:ABC-2 type transport system permease protein